MSEPVDIQACRLRATPLDSTGAPTGTPIIVDIQASVAVEPVYSMAQPLVERDLHGDVQVNRPGTTRFLHANLTLVTIGAHPTLAAALVGATAMTVASGVGVTSPQADQPPPANGVSLEVFTRRVNADGQPDSLAPYGWWVYPKVTEIRLQPFQHHAGAVLWAYVGTAQANAGWGTGPDGYWTEDLTDRAWAMLPAQVMPPLTPDLEATREPYGSGGYT